MKLNFSTWTNNEISKAFLQKGKSRKAEKLLFDVRQTKGEDYYISITESTKKFGQEGVEKHKVFIYKEDFLRFAAGLQEAIDEVRFKLLPDFDYEAFARRDEEWENEQAHKNQESPEEKNMEW
ncbi:MAG: DUF3276 family protein [Saprospiraceae bacterium]|nr:DUF3276 family protein [Saprospiraceae bacterium]